VCHEEEKRLAAIERLLNGKIERQVVPGYETTSRSASHAPRTHGSQRHASNPKAPGRGNASHGGGAAWPGQRKRRHKAKTRTG
jgi:hypothetical protein